MYAVKIDMPNLAKGAEVVIDGLGIFANGETKTVSKEEADAFRVHNRRQVGEYDENGDLQYTEESSPTLLEVFKSSKGVTVTTVKDDEEATKKADEEAAKKAAAVDTGKTLVEGGDK